MSLQELLIEGIGQAAGPQAVAWLKGQQAAISGASKPDLTLAKALGLAPRKVGKTILPSAGDWQVRCQQALSGWQPQRWRSDQAARVVLLLALPETGMADALTRIEATADVEEAVALHQALACYPCAADLVALGRKGLRSNMTAVFSAIAHHNPWPAAFLDEQAWNQMVLKAIFVGVHLDPIVGLDQRANGNLAVMLADYARERWAASRPVWPELWRCVGLVPEGEAVLREAVERERDQIPRQAVTLALKQSPWEGAAELSLSLGQQLPDWPSLIPEGYGT